MYKINESLPRLKNNETLLKYIKIDRFIDLISNNQLYFRRISKFIDNEDGKIWSFNNSNDLKIINSFPLERRKAFFESYSIIRENSFAACFTFDTTNNQKFLDEYLNNNEGVIIKTTSDNLHNSIIDEKTILSSVIKYDSLNGELGNHYAPLYYKLSSYKWENEYRLIYVDEKLGNTQESLKKYKSEYGDGIKIKIDIIKLIEHIYYFGNDFEIFKEKFIYLNIPISKYEDLV